MFRIAPRCSLPTGILLALLFVSSARAEVTFFQPPPHLMKDGYMSNVYHRNGADTHELVVGGWGDVYMSLFKFGLDGLPQTADAVYIDLYTGPGGGSTTGMHAWLLTSAWEESPQWDAQLYGYDLGNIPAPTENSWYILRIDSIYSAWKDNSVPNEGFLFEPLAIDNRFNRFRSSDISSAERQYRPILRVYYTPTVTAPAFKSPLPGGQSWLLTTEIGGTDCRDYVLNPKNYPLSTHLGENFYALDFAPYTSGGQYDSSVPVYASAGGRVVFAGWNSNKPCNGYHVIIDHDGDGSTGTGFQTYYLHLRSSPLVATGNDVSQGARLGTLGNTGSGQGCGTWGEHLHFQVKYRNQGSPSTDALAFVKVENRELREYLTDCDSSLNRVRYYPSSNTAQ